MNAIYSDLLSYIKSMDSRGSLLLFKGKDELAFLKEWMLSDNKTIADEKPSVADNSVSGMIQRCIKCKNAINKKYGIGSGENQIMIILNTPSDISRVERDKLKKESIDLLTKMIAAIKVELKDCYITNLIKCETESVLKPGEMLNNCEPVLLKEIDEYKPEIVIVMGDNIPIKKIINERKNISWYTISHPLTLLKNIELKKPAWVILQSVMAKLDENKARGF